MLGLGIGIPFRRRAVAVFSPSQLFANNEQGAWYDPSDLSTLYQDSAGTTPVTAVEQPVGLMLDKSKGLVLGPELVTNGDFSQGTTGWTLGSGWAATGGACVGTNVASGANAIVTSNIATVIGKWYEASWTISSYSTGTLQLLVFNGSGNYSGNQNVSAAGIYKFRFLATSTTTKVYFSPTTATAFNGVVDDVSLKELPGNHAFQTTSANRPVLSARRNLLVGTEVLSTQTVTSRATPYVLSFWGTGSITLSGTATGTLTGTGANNRVYLEFTPTAGTLTLTVSGSVTKAQLEVANEGL